MGNIQEVLKHLQNIPKYKRDVIGFGAFDYGQSGIVIQNFGVKNLRKMHLGQSPFLTFKF